jgi:hypothetical protein
MDGISMDSEVAQYGQPDMEDLDRNKQPNKKVAILKYND